MIPYIVCGVWLLIGLIVGLRGGVKIMGTEIGGVRGLFLAPLIAFLIGAAFLIVGAVFTAPAWIWLVSR